MAKYLLEAVLIMKIQPDKDICKPPHDKHEDKKRDKGEDKDGLADEKIQTV